MHHVGMSLHNRVLHLTWPYKQRWSDSLAFSPYVQQKAARGFGVAEKGHFSHKFNTRDNTFYRGPHPNPAYYGYDTMTEGDKATFMQWYKQVFQKEFCRYGVNDDVSRRR